MDCFIIAAACLHLMHCSAEGHHPSVVNVCDHEPAPSALLQRHAAELQGCPLPEARPYSEAEAEMSPMARSFWAENRRVSNALLCNTLGYKLLHPDFQAGLTDCWKRCRRILSRLTPIGRTDFA